MPFLVVFCFVFAVNAISILCIEHIEGQFRFYCLRLDGDGLCRSATYFERTAYFALIYEENTGLHVKGSGNLREREDIIRHTLTKLTADAGDKAFAGFALARFTHNRQRVDEHADGISET